jgi:hypoxanthine phosphoribosyltransferase
MTKILITPEQIKQKIDELAQQIVHDYEGKPLVLVGVLTGGFMVLADLARALWTRGKQDIDIDFVKTTSYVDECDESRCPPKITVDLNKDISGKHVLIVEDIADTGHTLHLLQNYLSANEPASLKTLALLNKPSRREVEIHLDYFGFEVDGWIEGYGLDSQRACPAITVRE